MPKGVARRNWKLLAPILLASMPQVSVADVADVAPLPAFNGNVVLLGSSSVNDSFGHLIASQLRRHGYDVLRKGYAAAGLSRPDFIDLSAKVASLPIPRDADAVLLYVGGNDAQHLWLRPEERGNTGEAFVKWDDDGWSELYEKRAKDLVEAICGRGARKVIFLPPADVVSTRMQRRLDRIRELQQSAAKSSTCGKFVATGGDAEVLKSNANALRAPDGVHMTREGAVRVWTRVANRVIELIRT